jgi:hypothetical protein
MSQLLLALMNAAAVQAERRAASTTAVPFTTGDCRRSREQLTQRGAVIVSEPQPMGLRRQRRRHPRWVQQPA